MQNEEIMRNLDEIRFDIANAFENKIIDFDKIELKLENIIKSLNVTELKTDEKNNSRNKKSYSAFEKLVNYENYK